MHLLILAADYPDLKGGVASYFIHTRNVEYVRNGVDVTVLSFKSKNEYTIDGIDVISEECYREKRSQQSFDVLLVHAPNLRNHYRFIRKFKEKFDKIVFFFHGHEVLVKSEIYPKAYFYSSKRFRDSSFVNNTYDKIKLMLWKKYFQNNVDKISLVFVSKWMKDMFVKYVKLDEKLFEDRGYIIYNCVGEEFLNDTYEYDSSKTFDFITIRNNLDGSKYGIDIVRQLAIDNPNSKFCVIGKGNFFNHYDIPQNIEWVEKSLSHSEVKSYLNQSKCALMPTRTDAQGVMSCEIATFGIPLITSDINVCKEIFKDFSNVAFIDNDKSHVNLKSISDMLATKDRFGKNLKFSKKNTIMKEIELFNYLLKEK